VNRTDAGAYLMENDECPMCLEEIGEDEDAVVVETQPPIFKVASMWRIHRACTVGVMGFVVCQECADGIDHDHTA
jgi:hypothetical protein